MTTGYSPKYQACEIKDPLYKKEREAGAPTALLAPQSIILLDNRKNAHFCHIIIFSAVVLHIAL